MGVDEVVEMPAELVVGVMMEAFDGCFLERPVDAFNLAVGPGVTRLGEPVIDMVLSTGVFEGMRPEQLFAVHGASDL